VGDATTRRIIVRERESSVPWAGLAFLLLTMGEPAQPAEAVSIQFSQTTGFAATGATLQTLDGGAPLGGHGRLEFFGAVSGPPGDLWSVVGWGCYGSCPAQVSDPFSIANRSALRATGFSGFLTDQGWVDISLIEHRNSTVTGNVLRSVSLESILHLDGAGVSIDDPDSILLNFRETPNDGSCEIAPRPGAAINPLGSPCDDFFFTESLDLQSIALGGGVFLDFRLDPRGGALVCTGVPANDSALCGGYAGKAIVVYTAESDINALAVQGRLRVIPPDEVLDAAPQPRSPFRTARHQACPS